MKIKSAIPLFIASLFICGSGWSAETSETQGIVVTIKPLHSMVSGVIGDTGEAELLLTGNTSPHDFQLTPSQVKVMQEARGVFYIDDSFETFLHRAFENLPKQVRKTAIVKMGGLNLLAYRKGGAWDAHGHEEHGHEEHGHEGHGHHDDEHDADMHVWLDPENARRMVKSITQALSAIYPENRSIYKANARAYIAKIDALHAELKASLAELQGKPFIVFHDAYQYFERAYNLSAVGSITFEPDESPSPNRIKEVREKLQQTGAQCVFREPQFSNRLVDVVTEGSNAKSGTLDPLGMNLQDGEALYFSLMRDLANNLKQCLT